MRDFIIIVLALYILYYAGNIVYDLFIKKSKVDEEQEEQIINIEGIDMEENVSNIKIDDVEELNTPQQFTNDEAYLVDDFNEAGSYKEDVDFFEEPNTSITSIEDNVLGQNSGNENDFFNKYNEKDFQELIKSSEAEVKVVKNMDDFFAYDFI